MTADCRAACIEMLDAVQALGASLRTAAPLWASAAASALRLRYLALTSAVAACKS
jgi:hypothetical protein